ncbi:MAG: hypothetical protein IKZ34_03760 [Alphaproteobacteria bacterium]|nr:hypothetical protein [Alphaproteobacteria bacterium]
MFGFNIFKGHHWHILSHAHLHGFIGFVFGALLLSILPIYLSTSTIIIRTKKPLITIPLPKLGKKSEEPKKQEDSKENKEDEKAEDFSHIPLEIRPAFARAKNHPLDIQIKSPTSIASNSEATEQETELPIPTDFDISFSPEEIEDIQEESMPIFKDFNFEDSTTDTQTNSITEHLDKAGIKYSTVNGLIVTDTQAIAVHNDSDFWVTDNENWFATGKSIPSPINSVKEIAAQFKVTPVLYLAEQNIMDIETLIPQWESEGIKVIQDLSEL